jgi:hypothetical protein
MRGSFLGRAGRGLVSGFIASTSSLNENSHSSMNSKSPVIRVQSCSSLEARAIRGDAFLAHDLAIGRHHRRALHLHLVAGVDHGAVQNFTCACRLSNWCDTSTTQGAVSNSLVKSPIWSFLQ